MWVPFSLPPMRSPLACYQDFGNFQDPQRISQDMSDRLRFGRFWFRYVMYSATRL